MVGLGSKSGLIAPTQSSRTDCDFFLPKIIMAKPAGGPKPRGAKADDDDD